MRLPSFRPRPGLRAAICLLLCVSVTNSQVPAPVPAGKPPAYPSWWFSQSVVPRLDPDAQTTTWPADYPLADDYAVLNRGQLKTLATAAYDEIESIAPDGAGPVLAGLVQSWYLPDEDGALPPPGWRTPSTADDAAYAAVNVGQMKKVAQPFYDRLIQLHYCSKYPWSDSSHSADDFAVANLGQAKNLFSFDLKTTAFAHDVDGNGLPDWWEIYWFGGVFGVSGNALAARGDGFTNLQAFQQRLNPNDFYNGRQPVLSIVSGGGQRGYPGSVLPIPLRVLIDSGAYNAPVTLTVYGGQALLSSGGSSPATSIQARSTSQFTNALGEVVYVAQVEIYLPYTVGDSSYIQINANGAPVGTTATVYDPYLSPPQNLSASVDSATSALLRWTPLHASRPTTVEKSDDGGANWSFQQTVNAGENQVIIGNLVPDQTVWFRLYTGDPTLGGESP
jgi:hypothetical protein